MSAKYHVNPETGRPNLCKAVHQCAYTSNGETPPHFDSKEDARAYVEESTRQEYSTQKMGGLQKNKTLSGEAVKNNNHKPLKSPEVGITLNVVENAEKLGYKVDYIYMMPGHKRISVTAIDDNDYSPSIYYNNITNEWECSTVSYGSKNLEEIKKVSEGYQRAIGVITSFKSNDDMLTDYPLREDSLTFEENKTLNRLVEVLNDAQKSSDVKYFDKNLRKDLSGNAELNYQINTSKDTEGNINLIEYSDYYNRVKYSDSGSEKYLAILTNTNTGVSIQKGEDFEHVTGSYSVKDRNSTFSTDYTIFKTNGEYKDKHGKHYTQDELDEVVPDQHPFHSNNSKHTQRLINSTFQVIGYFKKG